MKDGKKLREEEEEEDYGSQQIKVCHSKEEIV